MAPFALALRDVYIASRGASESRTTDGTLGLGHDTRLLSLMAQEVAEG